MGGGGGAITSLGCQYSYIIRSIILIVFFIYFIQKPTILKNAGHVTVWTDNTNGVSRAGRNSRVRSNIRLLPSSILV